MAIGPSGWTRTTTSRVKSPACCVHTTKGSCSWSEWRDSNPRLKAWKARGQPLPHIRVGSAYGYRTRPSALATRDASSTPRPKWTGSVRRPIELCQLSKTPLVRAWWAARDSNPIAPLGENGFTARQRTIRSYRPFWRQRQDSNPDPRGLEARMLPLHHAVVAASDLDRFRDRTSP